MVLTEAITQSEFGSVVGISQQAVSDLVRAGVLRDGDTAGEWLQSYCRRLREQAAGRLGSGEGGLDLATERAALARAQREGIEIRNAVLRKDYAPVSLLAEVLASASQNVAERFEHLPGLVRKACPDLPPPAIDRVIATIAGARNEWVRETAQLVVASVMSADDEDSPQLEIASDEQSPD